jgi:hypothetical protein
MVLSGHRGGVITKSRLHALDRSQRAQIMVLITSVAAHYRRVPFDFAQCRLSLSPVANEFGMILYFAGSEYSYS